MDSTQIQLLLVEDNPGDARFVSEVLRDTPEIDIYTVDRLSLGLEYLASHQTDIVLLDLGLPDSQGLDSLQTTADAAPHVPIVVLTGQDDEAVGQAAIREGAQDYLVKPVMPGRMLSRILLFAVERNRTGLALRESEEFNRKVLLGAHEGIIVYDAQLRYRLWNPFMEALTGVPASQLLGKKAFDVFPHLVRQGVDSLIRRALAGETVQAPDIPFSVPWTGRSGWVSASYSPHTSAAGKIVGVIGIVRDITQRKEAERALRASETRYRRLFEAARDGILILDSDTGQVIDVNQYLMDLLGYSKEDFLDRKLWEVVPFKDTEATKAAFLELQIKGYVHYEDLPLETRDGRSIDVEFATNVYQVNDEKVIQCNIRNITERKRAEKELQDTSLSLRESEARHRAVMEQSVDAIYLADVETKCIVEANPAFAQMLGYTLEEILRLSLYTFIADKREEVDRRFQKILQEGYFSFERQYIRKNGSLLDVWATGSRISYGGKEALSVIVRDLTEKKAMEAHLLRAQRMESIGLLAGGIAHDLNNILTPILINAELLGLSLSSPASQKMLASIASNAKRGADIVKQVLAFSRGTEGERLVLSPKHLLKEIERFVRETFPKAIAVEIEIPKDLWSIPGDVTQLQQVMMNLCVNAKDAMRERGTLTLSAQNFSVDETYSRMHPEAHTGPYVVLSVEDTGEGIPDSLLPKIFDPFFTTKQKGKGTGLGLATAYSILKSHGGFITVYSEVGNGTQFHVYLPASPSVQVAQVEEARAPLPSGNGEMILVVEDEASIREIIQMTLEYYGYRVIPAEDGSEAVALYAQRKGEVRAVITDLAMPIMAGPETIRALQKINPTVKVIAMSGLDAEGMVMEANEFPMKFFLHKPFTAERLLKTLAEVLATAEA